MSWENSGTHFNFYISEQVHQEFAHLNEIATKYKGTPRGGDARHQLMLGMDAIKEIVNGNREITKTLDYQRSGDLTDCDSTYIGTGRQERDMGLPAYRLVTRTLPANPHSTNRLPRIEFVAYGERENGHAYAEALRVLGRKPNVRLPEKALFKPIEPSASAPQPVSQAQHAQHASQAQHQR